MVRGFGFLTAKPLLMLLNIGEDQLGEPAANCWPNCAATFNAPKVMIDTIAGKIEMEIGQLDAEDAAVFLGDLGIEESGLDRIIARVVPPPWTDAVLHGRTGRVPGLDHSPAVRLPSKRPAKFTQTSSADSSARKSSATTR